MHKDLYNRLSVPAFLRGIRDRNAVEDAVKFSDPTTIRTAVDAVLHIQCATRTFGGRNLSNRQVAFSDEYAVNLTEKHSEKTTLFTQVVQGVVRQLQQSTVSLERPSSGTCFTCGGKGHRSRDCDNKRRRSPSPLSCFECGGKGHLARESSNTLSRRDPPVKRQSQIHCNRSSSNSSSRSMNSDDNHRYRSPMRPRTNHDRKGYRNDQRDTRYNWGESTRIGIHKAREHNSRQDGRDDNYRRKNNGDDTRRRYNTNGSPYDDNRGRYHQAPEENYSRSPSPRRDLPAPLNRMSDVTDKPLSN